LWASWSNFQTSSIKSLARIIETRRVKDSNKIERRLGRIQASHSQVNDLYENALRDTPEGVRLFCESKKIARLGAGCGKALTCFAPNLQAGTAEELWSRYAVDRGRGIIPRPEKGAVIRHLFHHEEPRVKAHVLVAFVGYALWVTLKHLLKRRPAMESPASTNEANYRQSLSGMKVLTLLSALQSADIVLPTTDVREIRLRRITEPTAEQKSVLLQLGISLPERFQLNRKCSADSATARTHFEGLSCVFASVVTNFG
jgi:hypothetical protein